MVKGAISESQASRHYSEDVLACIVIAGYLQLKQNMV